MKLTRNLFIPCLDLTRGKTKGTYEWCPIDLSTEFELGFNSNDEDYDYICYANTVTETTSYGLELPQEIALESDNPMYNFMYYLAMDLPTGSDAKIPLLLIEPLKDGTGALTAQGRVWDDASVAFDTLSTVDGKLSFNLKLNGAQKKGTVTIAGGNVITFTEGGFKTPSPDVANAVITAGYTSGAAA